jgi:hypothetical protein
MNQTERKYLIQLMNILGQMSHPGRDSKETGMMLMFVKDRQALITEGWRLIELNDKMNVYLVNIRK